MRWLSWLRVLAAKPGNLSSVLETHVVDGEGGLLQSCPVTSACLPWHTTLSIIKKERNKEIHAVESRFLDILGFV